jgi:hypothetical protein
MRDFGNELRGVHRTHIDTTDQASPSANHDMMAERLAREIESGAPQLFKWSGLPKLSDVGDRNAETADAPEENDNDSVVSQNTANHLGPDPLRQAQDYADKQGARRNGRHPHRGVFV